MMMKMMKNNEVKQLVESELYFNVENEYAFQYNNMQLGKNLGNIWGGDKKPAFIGLIKDIIEYWAMEYY